MEQDLSARRSRTAQFFAWLRGDQAQTQQQQTQKADRQVADGYTRGADDPDQRRASRQAGAPGPGTATPALTWDAYMADVQAREALQTAHRLEEARHPSGETAVTRAAETEMRQAEALAARLERERGPSRTDHADGLRVALEAAQQRFEAQQRAQQRQQGRGR